MSNLIQILKIFISRLMFPINVANCKDLSGKLKWRGRLVQTSFPRFYNPGTWK